MLTPFVLLALSKYAVGDIYIEQASKELNRGNFTGALTIYGSAISRNKDHYLAHFLRGSLYNVMRKYNLALSDFTAAIIINGNFHKARFNRAELYLRQCELDQALEDFKTLSSSANEFTEKATSQIKRIGQIKASKEDFEKKMTKKHYKDALAISNTFIDDISLCIPVRRLRCEALQATGDSKALLVELAYLSHLTPNDLDLSRRLGEIYMGDGKVEEAQTHLRSCLSRDPENSKCIRTFKRFKNVKKLLAEIDSLYENKKYQDVLTQAHVLEEMAGDLRFFLAKASSFKCLASFNIKKSDEALKLCSAAIKDDPEDLEVRFARAEIYLAKEQYDDAKSEYEEILSVDSNNARASEGLGKIDKIIKNKNKKDYYKILNVPRTATRKEIDRSYRALVKKNHPDRFKEEEQIKRANKLLQELNAAHLVLTDEEKRKIYDGGVDPLDPEQQSGSGGSHGGGSMFDQGSFFNFFRGGNPFGGNQNGGGQFRFTFG